MCGSCVEPLTLQAHAVAPRPSLLVSDGVADERRRSPARPRSRPALALCWRRGAVQHRVPTPPARPPVPTATLPPAGAHSLPASSSSRSGGSSRSSLTARSSQPMVQPSPPAAAAARRLGVRQGARRRRRRRAPAPLAHTAVTHLGPARPRAAGAPPQGPGGRAVGPPLALFPTRGWRGRGCERETWRLGPRTLRLKGLELVCLFAATWVTAQNHPVTYPLETCLALTGGREWSPTSNEIHQRTVE